LGVDETSPIAVDGLAARSGARETPMEYRSRDADRSLAANLEKGRSAVTEVMNVKDAMATVVQAHAVLADFHREVVAFFGIVDELLAAEEAPIRLEPSPENAQSVVLNSVTKFSQAAEWCPAWLGRFYRSQAAHLDDDEPDVDLTTKVKLATAFVWIAARPHEHDLPGAAAPECIVGVVDPGVGGKAKSFWDVARYGVWNTEFTRKLALGDWREGTFPDSTSRFGIGAFWCARRFLLEHLPDRDAIQREVAGPLLTRFALRFRE
jgi:hypothetical protein